MADPNLTLNALDALRMVALNNNNDQVATLCLATKAMYTKLETAESRRCELATVMVQLSSLLIVPNKRKVNKNDLLKILDNARDMISDVLEPYAEVGPVSQSTSEELKMNEIEMDDVQHE